MESMGALGHHIREAHPRGLSSMCKGFTLVEMLVATAIFAIVVAAAFVLGSGEARTYRTAEEVIAEQQNVRTGFDRMISEIRLAGFNTNPDGDPARTDEQIEGAWSTAITFRADIDFDDPEKMSVPE